MNGGFSPINSILIPFLGLGVWDNDSITQQTPTKCQFLISSCISLLRCLFPGSALEVPRILQVFAGAEEMNTGLPQKSKLFLILS